MCQKRDVELCVPITSGVIYRVRKCNVLCLIRYCPRAVCLPVGENL
jgi:hypothetical protein